MKKTSYIVVEKLGDDFKVRHHDEIIDYPYHYRNPNAQDWKGYYQDMK